MGFEQFDEYEVLGMFTCDCAETGHSGKKCQSKLPDVVNEPEKSYLDAFYILKPLGYFGSGAVIFIPGSFVLLSIFGGFDLMNWFVRRALAARDRRRREGRRRRQRTNRTGRLKYQTDSWPPW